METKDLDRWEDFVAEVDALRDPLAANIPLGDAMFRSDVLFRGQSDASWKLETTLERVRSPMTTWSLARYFASITRTHPAIVAHTGRQWSLPHRLEYDSWASKFDSAGSSRSWKAYEFMAYLRHHGFPSPLLDWSRSPYVAAFFAFRADAGASDRVAIYAYREDSGRGKVTGIGQPQIVQLHEYVPTHARHFRQQCLYTVCVHYDPDCRDYVATNHQAGGLVYANHEDVFQQRAGAPTNQDQLWKFTLPRALRARVLSVLNDFNLNAYSLFASEDALIETLAAAEIR